MCGVNRNQIYKFILLIYLFCTNIIFPLDKIQSLENQLYVVKESEKSSLFNKIASLYTYKRNNERILYYANKALEYSIRFKQIPQQVLALYNKSVAYIGKQNFDLALQFAGDSLNIAEKRGVKKDILMGLKAVAEVYNCKPEYEKSLEVYKRIHKLSIELNDKKVEANCYRSVGLINSFLGNRYKALENYKLASNLYRQISDLESTVYMLNLEGGLYEKLNHNVRAAEIYFKSLKICKENALVLREGSVYYYLGKLFFKTKDYNKSIIYFNKALEIYTSKGTDSYIINVYIKLGDIYFQKNDFINSYSYYNKALYKSEKTKLNIDSAIPIILLKIGNIYSKRSKYKKALEHYSESLRIAVKYKIIDIEMKCKYQIGEIYFKMDEYVRAVKNVNNNIEIAKKISDLEQIIRSYRLLSQIYETQYNFKNALNYYKLYSKKNREFSISKNESQIIEIESKYQVEQKEKENEILKKDNEIQKLDIERHKVVRNLVIVIFVLTLIIIGFLIRKYSFLLSFWKKKNFVGRYKLGEKIGSGGSGIVYMATDIHDKTKKVAIKILREESSTDNNYKKRFKSEGAIIDRFNHPNIVKVIERGEFGNTLFLAMEHLRGKSLDEIIKTESPLKITRIYKILLDITSAISAIHDKNIIHRDLKPENIIVCKNTEEFEQAKLLDFGIAKSKDLTSLTKTGSVLGTIHYLAPEQIQTGEITFKSDIYSLGIICYELLTGMKPFHAEEEEYILNKIINDDVQAPIELRSDIPQDMNELVLSMLMKDPKKRPTIKIILKYFQEKSTGEK